MTSRREMATPGLGGEVEKSVETDLTGGVPKPVKKTFAEQMSKAELDQRMKGSAVGVNVPGGPRGDQGPEGGAAGLPGAIAHRQPSPPPNLATSVPSKGWVKDL